jgi:hypothetical protein
MRIDQRTSLWAGIAFGKRMIKIAPHLYDPVAIGIDDEAASDNANPAIAAGRADL